MQSNAQTPEAYRPYFADLRATILATLPEGFEETIRYGLTAYVVPHSRLGFARPEAIPLALIAGLMGKMSIAAWVALYERIIKR